MPLLIRFAAALAVALLANNFGIAQSASHHSEAAALPEPNALISTSQSFDAVMVQAMERMHTAMAAVRASGQPDRDFLAAMVPHHQGAIDMAKAILLVTTDPRIRNLAQSIITEQQYEIELMQSLLDSSGAGTSLPLEKNR
jgi:uncharacterized protein (DUF305 family)